MPFALGGGQLQSVGDVLWDEVALILYCPCGYNLPVPRSAGTPNIHVCERCKAVYDLRASVPVETTAEAVEKPEGKTQEQPEPIGQKQAA